MTVGIEPQREGRAAGRGLDRGGHDFLHHRLLTLALADRRNRVCDRFGHRDRGHGLGHRRRHDLGLEVQLGCDDRFGSRNRLGQALGNLGLLGLFKYADFCIVAVTQSLLLAGIEIEPELLRLTLPVGISFYTFQTLSYTIDIYRGTLKPARSFLEFATFVSFFPQLVAGPIVRASEFLPQFAKRPWLSERAIGEGLFLTPRGRGWHFLCSTLLYDARRPRAKPAETDAADAQA